MALDRVSGGRSERGVVNEGILVKMCVFLFFVCRGFCKESRFNCGSRALLNSIKTGTR